MPSWSSISQEMLDTVKPDVVQVLNVVIRFFDMKIIFGRRTTFEQQGLFAAGVTTKDGVTEKSKHQADPPELSDAVDVVPYPVQWPGEDGISEAERMHRLKRFHVMAGLILGAAMVLGIRLRWGGDWNMNWRYDDQKFHDLGHFEMLD